MLSLPLIVAETSTVCCVCDMRDDLLLLRFFLWGLLAVYLNWSRLFNLVLSVGVHRSDWRLGRSRSYILGNILSTCLQMLSPQLLNHTFGLLRGFDYDAAWRGKVRRLGSLSTESGLELLMQLVLALVVRSHIGWLDPERVFTVRLVPSRSFFDFVVDIYGKRIRLSSLTHGVTMPSRLTVWVEVVLGCNNRLRLDQGRVQLLVCDLRNLLGNPWLINFIIVIIVISIWTHRHRAIFWILWESLML